MKRFKSVEEVKNAKSSRKNVRFIDEEDAPMPRKSCGQFVWEFERQTNRNTSGKSTTGFRDSFDY